MSNVPAVPLELTDICCNLTHESFAGDREQVLAQARQAGVTRLLLAGASLAESRDCIQLAQTLDHCFAAVGVHPHHAHEWGEDSPQTLRDYARQPRVVAIGECGLDYYRDLSPRSAQLAAFTAQLELAGELELPTLLHNRDADEDFLRILDEVAIPNRQVLHCFTGGQDLLQACLERGLYIGVTGWFCDERRGGDLRAVIDQIPLDRLMLETDAPYLLPRNLKPKPKTRRNEPQWLPHIAQQIAHARGLSVEELARHTQACAQQFFGFPELKSSEESEAPVLK